MPKKKTTPTKKAPTRDRQKVVITPEQLAEAKERLPGVILEYRGSYVSAMGRRDLDLKVMSAAIDGDHIHLSVSITGTVTDPTHKATAKGETIAVKVPAKVERREVDEPVKNNEPDPFPNPDYDDESLPFPDLG